MGDQVGFRSWKSFVDSDEMGLPLVWQKALVQLALLQHMEANKEGEAPAFEDAKIVFDEACSGKLLPWWPQKLERVLVKIRVTPHGSTTEMLGPHPLDPNTKDFGKTMFGNIVGNLLEACGDLDGSVQIQILRATDKSILGGFRNESVVVGPKMKKRKGGSSPDGRDEMFEYVTERLKEKDAQMERMFTNSAHVIGSAAHLVNATRGVNPAPPWMNGEDGMPLWFALLNGAMQIGGAVLTGKDPKSQIQKIMQEPTHPMLGDMGRQQQRIPQLPDYGGSRQAEGPSYGSDQFLDEGQYDGFRVVDEDLLDDGFDEEEKEAEWDEDEDEEWDEDDDSEEDEKPRKRKKKSNPFEGMSDREVEAAVDQWMSGKDKGKLQEIGARLASKVLR